MTDPLELAREALAALGRGDHPAAERLSQALLAASHGDPNAHQILGAVAMKRGAFPQAADHFAAAAESAPMEAGIQNSLGAALRRAGDLAGARTAFERAIRLKPGLAAAHANLGNLHAAQGRRSDALACYRRALALNPRSGEALGGLAQVLEATHDLQGARAAGEAAVALEPDQSAARLALAAVALREKRFEDVMTHAGRVLARDTSAINRSLALGLNGQSLERLGRCDEAFEEFRRGNELLQAHYRAAHEDEPSLYHPHTVERLATAYAREDTAGLRAPPDDPLPPPVFLIGFPRSGTTLLDQILASHPMITTLEEKDTLGALIGPLLQGTDVLARLREMSADEIVDLRARYRARLAEEAGPDARPILIDKLPLNTVLVGPLHRLFPRARIIFALRDPRDCVLSCFQQRFGMNAAMYRFLSLTTAADYYDAVMRLWETYRAKLALDVHVVRYEDVVADLEAAIRPLTAFLGVPYDAAMTRYAMTARGRTVSTPSARAVTEPIYAHAVGKWRRYQGPLAPVLPILAPWVERHGYGV